MKSKVSQSNWPAPADIDVDAIKVGKDVLELLTSGMYVSPITIYREYVQNAADAFDAARTEGFLGNTEEGVVTVDIDHTLRSVTIRDNGTGLRFCDIIPNLLAIGGSQKRGTRARGFRGVGRLSGLAYCRMLEFRTKAPGEDVITSIKWDCRKLRSKLSDNSFIGDLRDVIHEVVSIGYKKTTETDLRFFEVHLHEVARLRNDLLLNERLVSQFLEQVAPLPFAQNFTFAGSIERSLTEKESRIPINLIVAGKKLSRPYRNEIEIPGTSHKINVEEVEIFRLANVDSDVGAIGWIAHHQYSRNVPSTLGIRGLRARVGDIQVGGSDIFEETFKEPRFNSWSIGEIHILDRRIVPNARRDDFEANHHYYNLLAQIGPLATTLSQRCRTASVSRNAAQIVRNIINVVQARLDEAHPLDPAEFSRLKASVSSARAKLKRISNSVERSSLSGDLEVIEVSLSTHKRSETSSVVSLDEAEKIISRIVTNRNQAIRLMNELKRLCS